MTEWHTRDWCERCSMGCFPPIDRALNNLCSCCEAGVRAAVAEEIAAALESLQVLLADVSMYGTGSYIRTISLGEALDECRRIGGVQ